MAFEDSLYGLPLAVKSVALFYRSDLVAAPPRTTDELFELRENLPDDIYPLVYENTDLYGHASWLHGFGGSIFGSNGSLRIASPEAADALSFARELSRKRVVPSGVDGRMVPTLFNEGKAAMAISGPWFLGDVKKRVPWKVTTLPVVSKTGQPARPFLGAEGVLMSTRAKNKDRAFRVMRALTSTESALYRARHARQVVPNKAAYEAGDIASNEALMAFRAQLDQSVPMSASVTMRTVWTPYQTALLKVIDQDQDVADSLREAESEVRRFVEDTQ
jgi:arabinogalactan oligomer/maltooligosaccharide transport system permease protein